VLPELKPEQQNWTNPFKDIKLTPYRLIAAGGGPRNVVFPDGSILSAGDVKRELNYPGLFAWNAEKKELLESVEFLHKNPDSNWDLVVDSGAYSAWSKGKMFDMDEYITFLESNKILDVCFWAAEADVIPGSFGVDPTEEQRLSAPEESWNNYLYMIKRVSWPKKIVPIFHQGEDFKHLRRMLEYTFPDGDHIPYIGISPRNDVHVSEKMKWYEMVWGIIRESSNPNVLTHNFGMTTISMMEQYPSCSSDSTSCVRSASFGNIMLVVNGKVKSIYVSDRHMDSSDHILNQPQAIKEAVEEECKRIGHGLTLNDLVYNDPKGQYRALFNLFSLYEWSSNFVYEGTNQFKESLWD